MTNQHPITLPPELIAKWAGSMCGHYEAAQWGADQELEACCKTLDMVNGSEYWSQVLRSDRRPKSPSLKEQALEALREAEASGHLYVNGRSDTIRRALEALDD